MNLAYEHPTPDLKRGFYDHLRARTDNFRLVQRFEIAPTTGKGILVEAGQCAKLICHQGPQIVDVCVFNRHDSAEHLWSGQTLNREGAYMSVYSRLWSTMPMFRPMMTVIEDTVVNPPDINGIRHHSILGAHCNPRFWGWAFGNYDHDFSRRVNCYYNLLSAMSDMNIPAHLIHDNLNLFQRNGIDKATGKCVMLPTTASAGDYVTFFAEFDVVMILALCPQGSGRSLPHDPIQDPKPLLVEVYDTEVSPLSHGYVPV